MARIKVDQKNPDGTETRLLPQPPGALESDGLSYEPHLELAPATPEALMAEMQAMGKQQAQHFTEFGGIPEPVASPLPEPPAQPESRPSLEVAIETHRNLQKRVEALCGRLMAWDVRSAPCGDFQEAVQDMVESTRWVGKVLLALQVAGFVAKTTDSSRKEARLALGGPVKLSDATKKVYAYAYSPEELDEVTVVSRTDDHVWVKLGHRENALPIPLKLSQLVLG